jgi:L-ascorbate metabolism protein UlaG (beta-lactamase superfamily)
MPVTTITFLDNSGFALEAENRFFVFDYYNDRPVTGRRGLAGGVIDPRCAAGKDVFVFVSHSHFDHYNKIIFQWAKHIENIHYVLSDDVPPHEGALMARPATATSWTG